MTNRREFLQTTAAIAGSLILPNDIFALPTSPDFHFIHADADSCKHWPVTDPVQWSIEHSHEPILARAAEGLAKLTLSDGDRIIRLVLRRCSLNLLEVLPDSVVVNYWGSHHADLKPFFKTHGMARPEIEVVLRDRKKEITSTTTGDSFLYAVPLASDFDLEHFQSKWKGRFERQDDDWMAAPGTSSGFAWDGLEDGSIPWAAMKSVWRSGVGACLNCSGPTMVVNVGLHQVGMFNRSGFVENVCGTCRRSFRDSVRDVGGWMAMNLDSEFRPSYEMIWGKRVTLEALS